jgi:SAM-dependent methyltransferase
MSWNEAFASRYGEWLAHMTTDVAFYISLALHADGPLVELAFWNGRGAIPIAQVKGWRVIGTDSSAAMVDQARRRAAEAGVELELIEGDMMVADGAQSSLWWATKNEWLGLLDVAGLQVEALYGVFAGEPFTDDNGV